MALRYNHSWLHGLNIMLAILTVSLAIEEGQVKCLHSEYDKFSVKNDLQLCCVYRKEKTEMMESLTIKWQNKSSSKRLNEIPSWGIFEKDDARMWCIDIKKGDYADGHRMSCSIFNNTKELIDQCTFEVALFYNNPLDFHSVTKLSWSIVALLSSLFLIVILILFLKLLLKLCRKSTRYSFHDTNFEGMTPTSRESVLYSRIASISNPKMYGTEDADMVEAMLNRSRFPTYLQVEVDELENVIDEEVYENESGLSRTPVGSVNHPDLVKSDKGSSYRKAGPLPNSQRTNSTSSTNTTDCRNHCCLHHHITRNRPGCFKKPLKRYTSV